jgi:hypothetical protein
VSNLFVALPNRKARGGPGNVATAVSIASVLPWLALADGIVGTYPSPPKLNAARRFPK